MYRVLCTFHTMLCRITFPNSWTIWWKHLRIKEEGMKEHAVEHSRTHGHELWKAGYNISELIWEIYMIRRVLTQTVLPEFAREHTKQSVEECAQAATLIHDFFHRVTCDSVEQFVNEQQRAIQKTHEELQLATDSRERLTRTVAHELRNILNALTLATKLLGGEADERRKLEIGATCTRMLSDMTRILNDLLEYSAFIAGRSQLTVRSEAEQGTGFEVTLPMITEMPGGGPNLSSPQVGAEIADSGQPPFQAAVSAELSRI
jgi:His Kinase A (phospho-acceptor) domain